MEGEIQYLSSFGSCLTLYIASSCILTHTVPCVTLGLASPCILPHPWSCLTLGLLYSGFYLIISCLTLHLASPYILPRLESCLLALSCTILCPVSHWVFPHPGSGLIPVHDSPWGLDSPSLTSHWVLLRDGAELSHLLIW